MTCLLLAAPLGGCATFETYTADEFDDRTAQHEIVALLPLDVTLIVDELPEDMTEEDMAAQERDEGYVFQQQLHTELLERREDGEFSVRLQDIGTTNVLLERGDVGYPDMHISCTKSELASILDVDAVVSGSLSRDRPVGAGTAVASAMITGILTGGALTAAPATNQVNVSVAIHDGADGLLLWSFDDELSGGLGASPEAIAEQRMGRTAREFPYAGGPEWHRDRFGRGPPEDRRSRTVGP